MKSIIKPLHIALCGLSALAGCSAEQDIDPDGQIFTSIASETEITLLGTEPFWGIEVSPHGGTHLARYTSPENSEGTIFEVERFAGNNGLGFSGNMNGRLVQIAITPGACSDGMSDRTYPYTATVAFGDATLFGCGYTGDEPFEGEATP
ncbi:COG3650 family protein [Erythrobacter rubeus]|uniref:Lipoprotein n=1 Tax=Erythrobacter rubeus TaxID=2760803 RepID=A0ABR8KRM5_9SPHN|nr:hypothetical protein [Erythrobacter rubeus]MBD2840897.1 hypothetical protein [Erythrobacter rubeus]